MQTAYIHAIIWNPSQVLVNFKKLNLNFCRSDKCASANLVQVQMLWAYYGRKYPNYLSSVLKL